MGAGPLGRTLVEVLEPLLGQLVPVQTPGGVLRLVEVTVSPSVVIDAANQRATVTATVTAEVDTAVGATVPLNVEMVIHITVISTGEGVEINEPGVQVQVQVLGADVSVPPDALKGLIAEALRTVLPVVIPVALPGGDDDFCDIGLRNLAVAFLPGEASRTAPSLDFFASGLRPVRTPRH